MAHGTRLIPSDAEFRAVGSGTTSVQCRAAGATALLRPVIIRSETMIHNMADRQRLRRPAVQLQDHRAVLAEHVVEVRNEPRHALG